MGKTVMDVEQLAQLYSDGVDFTRKVQDSVDACVAKIKQLKDSDCFEGNQGDRAREVCTYLSSLMTKFADNTKVLDKFLDDKIGQALVANMKNNFDSVNDKVKALLQKRLRK